MKTNKTNSKKRPNGTKSGFPCMDFEKMAEMIKDCCPDEGGTFDCCSMMRQMMERGQGAEAKKTGEKQKAPENDENA